MKNGVVGRNVRDNQIRCAHLSHKKTTGTNLNITPRHTKNHELWFATAAPSKFSISSRIIPQFLQARITFATFFYVFKATEFNFHTIKKDAG